MLLHTIVWCHVEWRIETFWRNLFIIISSACSLLANGNRLKEHCVAMILWGIRNSQIVCQRRCQVNESRMCKGASSSHGKLLFSWHDSLNRKRWSINHGDVEMCYAFSMCDFTWNMNGWRIKWFATCHYGTFIGSHHMTDDALISFHSSMPTTILQFPHCCLQRNANYRIVNWNLWTKFEIAKFHQNWKLLLIPFHPSLRWNWSEFQFRMAFLPHSLPQIDRELLMMTSFGLRLLLTSFRLLDLE